MIIAEKIGKDILTSGEKRICFAISSDGYNNTGFAGIISKKFWPEIANSCKNELGTIISKEVNGITFYALCCHSLEKGWSDQETVIRKCFDSIPGEDPVAAIRIGTDISENMSGAKFSDIRAGMEASEKRIILY